MELRGDLLIVTTPVRDLAGWQVRTYRAPLIRFEGRSWRITACTTLTDSTTRFELVAWDPGAGEIPGPEIEYSPESVALRDHALTLGRRRSRGTMLLNYISPLTGFLAAGTKHRLEVLYGIDPVTSTQWSVFIQFLAALSCFVLASIGTMVVALGYPGPFPSLLLVAGGVVIAVDGSVRWGRLLSEERPAPGFYEWLFRRRQ